jgi:hypothetical protein
MNMSMEHWWNGMQRVRDAVKEKHAPCILYLLKKTGWVKAL